jgi:hypothetical protein
MSGGTFDYVQYRLGQLADELECYARSGKYWENGDAIPDDIVADIRTAMSLVERAQVYVQRLDWLIAGDDGEESYRKRLAEDLAKLDNDLENEK